MLITAGLNEFGGGFLPFESEIFMLGLDGSVCRLAHHRSSECGYWTQPKATISRDGRLAVYSSDWGINPCPAGFDLGAPDPYVIYIESASSAHGWAFY